jgi:phosphoserine phosphatase
MPRDIEPVFICDLDGTMLRVNSFPLWVLFLIGGRLPRLRLGRRALLSLQTQGLLLRRKLGRIDHEHLLRRLQAVWHAAGGPEVDSSPALEVLRHWTRSSLGGLLRRIAANEVDAVLATAAAGEYAIGLGHHLGFRHIIATPCQLSADEHLNAGKWKLLRVMEFLYAMRWEARPLVVLTDHLDDLPLMRYADVVGWFGPSEAAAEVSALARGVRYIACRELDGEAMAEALSTMEAYARSCGRAVSSDSIPAPSDSTPA